MNPLQGQTPEERSHPIPRAERERRRGAPGGFERRGGEEQLCPEGHGEEAGWTRRTRAGAQPAPRAPPDLGQVGGGCRGGTHR